MDDESLYYKYHFHPSGSALNALIYHFLLAESNLRRFLHLDQPPSCTLVTCLSCLLCVLLALCSRLSVDLLESRESLFWKLDGQAKQNIPRKESVASLGPAYDCVRQHLLQSKIFLEKTRKMVDRANLEMEIANSRLSCIKKLLRPEARNFPYSNGLAAPAAAAAPLPVPSGTPPSPSHPFSSHPESPPPSSALPATNAPTSASVGPTKRENADEK